MTHFRANDAYSAAILEDGQVVVSDLSDPTITPTIVAEFIVQGAEYLAFWHDDLNCWEVFGPAKFYRVCESSDPFWGFCEQTATAFHDRLLTNSGGSRLSRRLARKIQEKIDGEIIRSLQITLGVQPTPAPSFVELNFEPSQPIPDWTLVPKFTIEPKQNLQRLRAVADSLVGRSLLKSK